MQMGSEHQRWGLIAILKWFCFQKLDFLEKEPPNDLSAIYSVLKFVQFDSTTLKRERERMTASKK